MRKFPLRKKFTPFIAAVLALTVAASAALAFPGGRGVPRDNGNAKRQELVQLKDIQGHWAEPDIAEMAAQRIIRGYPGGVFQPNKPVTHAEAIVMLAHALNLNQQADMGSARHKIPGWAQEAVAKAVYAGILTQADLTSFRPNQPARRYEIAVYVIRALRALQIRLEEENRVQLEFVDKDAIPVAARVYVALADRERLMVGEPAGQAGYKFQPHRPVTRAEMAALMVRIQNYLENALKDRHANPEVTRVAGTVAAVYLDSNDKASYQGSLSIEKADGTTVTAAVYDSTYVYHGRKRINLEDVRVGDTVRAILSDGVALFIRVCSEEECAQTQVRLQERSRIREQDHTGWTSR